VERHLFDKAEDKKPCAERWNDIPYATYFSSPSSNGAITSLLRVCKESRVIIKKQYSQIFPSTWFSFSKDYLYLDWGRRHYGTVYEPCDFDPDRGVRGLFSHRYAHPKVFDAKLANEVRNLVVRHEQYPGQQMPEAWLMDELLPIFPKVKVLVLADQLHDLDEATEDLVWFYGTLGEELVELEAIEYEFEDAQRDRRCFTNLLLWKDKLQYYESSHVGQQTFSGEWAKKVVENGMESRDMPHIFNKSIVTAAAKKMIMKVCSGRVENIRQLASMDWGFVTGEHPYNGALDLRQQIAYLELVIGRIEANVDYDEQGVEVRGNLVEDINELLVRRDLLVTDLEFRELMISEAEEWIVSR